MSEFNGLGALLAPRSVVVLGASDRPGNLGGVAISLLQRFGYAGDIWPVNPGNVRTGGLPCYPSLEQVPGRADVAILAVPADALGQAVRDCAAAGIRTGIAWAGGFAEVGGAGIERQRTLAQVCRETGFRLCGPNCLGVINTSTGFTGTFSSSLAEVSSLLQGSISMISQSGGMSLQALALAQREGFGFRFVISCGNEVALSAAELLLALADDAGTKVIALYLEAVADGPAFLAALHAARMRGKPVVILKGGASVDSGRAALAHTGRLAGEDRAFEAVFRETAAIRVYSLEELLDVVLLIASLEPGQLPEGDAVVMTTFGGGAGVLSVDQCIAAGLRVPAMSEQTRGALTPLLTPLASTANPVDLTPQSANDPRWLALLPQALAKLPEDPNFDTLVFLTASTSHREVELVDAVRKLRLGTRKPVVVSWSLASERARRLLAEQGIHAFTESARAIRALAHLVRHRQRLSQPLSQAVAARDDFPWRQYVPDGPGARVITEDVVAAMIDAAGLAVAAGRMARSASEAVAHAQVLGMPVALKGIASALPHRASAGFLALNLQTPDDVARTQSAFEQKATTMGISYDGSWVQRMAPKGTEILLSAFRDAHFGVMIVCGAGGGLTELLQDVVVCRAPIDRTVALANLRMLRVVRNDPQTRDERALGALADYLVRFSAWIANAPWPRFTFELNPLIWRGEQILAVDGLLVLDEEQHDD